MKSKTRLFLSMIALFFLFFAFGITVFAQTQQEPSLYHSILEETRAVQLEDSLPRESADILQKLGISGIDLYSLLETSPRDMLSVLFDLLQGDVKDLAKSGITVLVLLIFLSFGLCFVPENDKLRHILEVSCGTFSLVLLIPGLSNLMRGAIATLRAGGDFGLLLVPILAGIIAIIGNPALALSYHSLTFAAAEGLLQLTNTTIIPASGIVLGLSFVGAAAPHAQLTTAANAIKKTIIGSFGLLAGLFTTLLGLKSIIANTADALVVRSVRIVTASIPLVGGALSEACSAILSSASLLKGAVGGFALFALFAIYSPILVKLFLWSLMFKLLAKFCELFSQNNVANIFNGSAYAVAILSACVIFNAALLLISTGLVISVKNN